ncbi:MAG: polysaccharide pyruvyl transferase family protein [Lachnospiraceae bacterium]
MIGLITFHCSYNYGSALQTYALQKKLQELSKKNGDMGGCSILNYYYTKDMKGFDVRWGAGLKVLAFDLLTFPQCSRRKLTYKRFRKRFFNQTEQTSDWRELERISADCDTLVCGSDQVWNLWLVEGGNPAYFLKFAKPGQKKIAYAPSIASSKISDRYASELKETLSDFTAISVREEGSDKALSKIIDREVKVVLDPTLLVDRTVWDSLIADYKIKLPKKYIFVYSIHQMNLKKLCPYAEDLAEQLDAEIVYFNKYNIYKKRYALNIFTKDPRAFVAAIKNADFIIGDSFHSSVFSIIYHKPFMSYSLDDSRLRLDSLFSRLEIPSHFLGESEYEEIDYEKVQKKLDEFRADSLQFLQNALKG